MPGRALISSEIVDARWKLLPAAARSQLLDAQTSHQMQCYAHNIEHFIGTAKVPVGIAGPLRVNGLFASGDYYVPLATTEAALVASLQPGAAIATAAGGVSAMLLNEGVSRSPVLPSQESRRWDCSSAGSWSTRTGSGRRRRPPRAMAGSSTCRSTSKATTCI